MACKYCEELIGDIGEDIWGEDFWDCTDRFHLYKSPTGFRIECYGDESATINFCPMCGRDLREYKKCCGTDSTNAENANP